MSYSLNSLKGGIVGTVLRSMFVRRGFLRCLLQVMRLRPDALLHAGPPCSSFVWVNSSTHKRNVDILGDESLAYIQQANAICCRTCLLLLVALVRCVQYGVEQPRSSKLYELPWFQFLEQLCYAIGIPVNKSF